MTIRSIVILVVALSGCIIDADLGSQPVGGEPSDEPDDPPDGPTYSIVYEGSAGSILVDGDDLVISGYPRIQDQPEGILRVKPDGSIEVVVLSDKFGRMVEDDGHYYVAKNVYEQPCTRSAVVAIDKTTLVERVLSSGWCGIEDIEVDDTYVYFGTQVDDGTGAPMFQLVRVSKEASHQKVLIDAMDTPFGIESDGDTVYVAEDIDGDYPDCPQRILAVSRQGGPVREIVRGANRPSDVLVVGDWLYFTERGNDLTDGTISRIRRSTIPSTAETLVTGLGHPTWLAVDDTYVYWSAYFSGLQRAPLDGGPAETLLDCAGVASVYDPANANWVQGCGAIALRPGSVVYSARNADNFGTIYSVPR